MYVVCYNFCFKHVLENLNTMCQDRQFDCRGKKSAGQCNWPSVRNTRCRLTCGTCNLDGSEPPAAILDDTEYEDETIDPDEDLFPYENTDVEPEPPEVVEPELELEEAGDDDEELFVY